MFFAHTAPATLRRHGLSPAGRSLERFLDNALLASRQQAGAFSQDDTGYTLSIDLPGIAREQLSIGIEGCVVRIESKQGAARQYKAAYELPQDIDATTSEAKLELGVLTLKLTKKVVASNVSELPIN